MEKKIVNYRPLFYSFLAFLFGINVARLFYAGVVFYVVVVLLTLSLVATLTLVYGKYKILLIILACFFLGNGWFYLGQATWEVKAYDGVCSVVGTVGESIKDNNGYSSFILENVHINGEKSKNISVSIRTGQELKPAYLISFESELDKAKLFDLREFSSYYYRNNIGYSATVYSDIVVVPGKMSFDQQFRATIKENLYENLSENNAAISYAVLFGDKNGIDANEKSYFNEAGVLHILTVSGLHVGFLIAFLYGIFKLCRANKYFTFVFISLFLMAYSFLCGFAPSVVRASVMGIVMLSTRLSGRRYDSLSAWSIAGFLICGFSPLTALDSGFLMSFFSVATIFMLYPVISNGLMKIFPRFAAQSLALTISAQLGIIPFVALFFQNINFLSIFANLLIVPLFSLVFPLLFVVAFLSSILPFMAKLLLPFDFCFTAIKEVARFFSISTLKIKLRPFDLTIPILLYAFIFVCSRFVMLKPILKAMICSVISMFMVIAFVVQAQPTNVRSSIDFVSYNGQAITITDKYGEKLMLYNNIYDTYLDEYAWKYKYRTIENVVYVDSLNQVNLSFLKVKNTIFRPVDEDSPNQINKPFSCGNFDITYNTLSEKYIGVTIEFDNHKFFFATNKKLSYNNANEFENFFKDYDLVYCDKNSDLAQFASCTTITLNKYDASTYSLQELGNFRLQKDFRLRGLD